MSSHEVPSVSYAGELALLAPGTRVLLDIGDHLNR